MKRGESVQVLIHNVRTNEGDFTFTAVFCDREDAVAQMQMWISNCVNSVWYKSCSLSETTEVVQTEDYWRVCFISNNEYEKIMINQKTIP